MKELFGLLDKAMPFFYFIISFPLVMILAAMSGKDSADTVLVMGFSIIIIVTIIKVFFWANNSSNNQEETINDSEIELTAQLHQQYESILKIIRAKCEVNQAHVLVDRCTELQFLLDKFRNGERVTRSQFQNILDKLLDDLSAYELLAAQGMNPEVFMSPNDKKGHI